MKPLKVIAVSWVALAVTVSGITGLVLCFGPDGRFALKIVHQGRCHDVAEEHGHGRQGVAKVLANADADCCGSCVDVSFSSDTMSLLMSKVRRSLTVSDHLAQVFSAASVQAVFDAECDRGPPLVLVDAALRTSPALLSQRTIVLRI